MLDCKQQLFAPVHSKRGVSCRAHYNPVAAAHPSQVKGPPVGLTEERMAIVVSPSVRPQVVAFSMPTGVEPEAHLQGRSE